MKITSPAFEHGAMIPGRFSRYGQDRTPPLNFDDVPADALSLALIMDDPDAPHGLFTHWIVFNIDQNTSGFTENRLPRDVRHGTNSWGEARYGGPRPPDREHRYFFHLYALDRRLDLPEGATREEIEDAITGHIVAEAELMGRYAPPVHA